MVLLTFTSVDNVKLSLLFLLFCSDFIWANSIAIIIIIASPLV